MYVAAVVASLGKYEAGKVITSPSACVVHCAVDVAVGAVVNETKTNFQSVK